MDILKQVLSNNLKAAVRRSQVACACPGFGCSERQAFGLGRLPAKPPIQASAGTPDPHCECA